MTGQVGPGAAAARPSSAPLHRNRDFMVLWTSQVASTVGTRVSGIAYPLLVLAITGSPALAGIVAFAQTVPFLILYLPAGALVDRWDRRRIMVVCEVGRAIALGSVAVTTALGSVSVPQLVIVALAEGTMFVFFDLCEGAVLPRLVPGEQLPAAIAQNQARTQGADLVGQPLGGALFGIGRAFPFAFDMLSYLVSFFALLTIRTPLTPSHVGPRSRLRTDIAEGLRAVWRQPFLRVSIAVAAGQNFAWSALMLVLIVRAQQLGADPGLIGLMFGIMGAGAIGGAIAAPTIVSRVRIRPLLVAINWLWAIQVAAVAVLPNVVAIGIVMAALSVGGPISNVAIGSVLYRVTPDAMLGRVRSVTKALAWGATPLGSLAAGFLAVGFGAQGAIVALAGVLALVAAGATLSKGLRHVPET
jgi:hypothetical protein